MRPDAGAHDVASIRVLNRLRVRIVANEHAASIDQQGEILECTRIGSSATGVPVRVRAVTLRALVGVREGFDLSPRFRDRLDASIGLGPGARPSPARCRG